MYWLTRIQIPRLKLAQMIGIAWLTESTCWHCPRGVVLLPVVDINVRLPFNVI